MKMVPFVNKRFKKVPFFFSKSVYRKGKGLDLGTDPLYKIFVE